MSGATDEEGDRAIKLARAIDQALAGEADESVRLAALSMALVWQVFMLCDTPRHAAAHVEAVAETTIAQLEADWSDMVAALHGGVQ